LVGPLKRTTGGFTHLLVAIYKFSKWIEVRPITSIRSEQAVLFFIDIVHRFGVPNYIIMHNGTQFTGKKFLDPCALVGRSSSKNKWPSRTCQRHGSTRPKVENFRQTKQTRQKRATELPSVLWSLRTTLSQATRFNPFFLVYGSDAMLPTDVEYGSPRLKAYNE
jgi:hypothetical protein